MMKTYSKMNKKDDDKKELPRNKKYSFRWHFSERRVEVFGFYLFLESNLE